MMSKSRDEYKCFFLQRDCAITSQFCGLTLAPKSEPTGAQSVWSKERARADYICGCSFIWRNALEAFLSKRIISLSGLDIRMLHA